MRDFGDNVFAGTAKYYAKYRPSYPRALFDDIVAKFKLDGRGGLLDLGCGTGEMAIPLAKYFEKVLALDPDEQMLNEGRKKAKKLKVDSIEWQKGSSKTLTSLQETFRVVVMGQSFHWMDGAAVLERLHRLIEDNGGVAIVGTVPTPQNKLSTEKDLAVKEVITKYLGPKRRAGKRIYKPMGGDWEQELLPRSAFSDFTKHSYVIEIKRSDTQIIGNLFSMSFASKKLLGDSVLSFENELKQKLKAISDGKKFVEHVRFDAYLLEK